jgi:hypothetical protein
MSPADLHPDVAPLAFLLGRWAGPGRGEYPTIEPFGYTEEVTFGFVPNKPFLVYGQRTRHADDGRPLHAETGYWRCVAGREVEVVLAHPTGIAEVLEGTLDGRRIELASTALTTTATAKAVTATRRSFEVDGEVLRYRVAMAAVGVPLTHHLAADLRRQDDPGAG